tara:strand:- start:389 stop:574 length:186 start_codon:yes stop_codon:yes gene_type:complete
MNRKQTINRINESIKDLAVKIILTISVIKQNPKQSISKKLSELLNNKTAKEIYKEVTNENL